MEPPTLFTIGYGRWPAERRREGMLRALKEAAVTLLVDVRLSPCSSNADPNHTYGPKPWNLQQQGDGIESVLRAAGDGIRYLWLSELGNPQKNVPGMAILHEHIASADERWPVNRGLKLLHGLVERETCCLLCACKTYEHCHRQVIADALRDHHFGGDLAIHHLG